MILRYAFNMCRHVPHYYGLRQSPILIKNRYLMTSFVQHFQCGDAKSAKVIYKEYQPPRKEDHDYKNMKMGRPMSPHLEIQAPLLTATVSILQRATGIIMAFYATVLAGSALLLPNGIDSLVYIIQSMNFGGFMVIVFKTVIGTPFWFHYLNGFRFIAFNLGIWKAFEKAVYRQTGYAALSLSITLSALCAFVGK